jgi:hypothetical protein
MIITLIVVVILVGLGLYLAENFVPMDPMIKVILRVVVILFLFLYVLRVFRVPLGL